ncbi:hypothetical protein COB72_06300 [bacterium]|nr:MAG: hypothetical protein COB72_06300 [bacterium]
MQHQPLIVRWSMPIAIMMLFVLALAPIRMLSWTDWFSDQVQVVILPIAGPIEFVVDFVVPPEISNPLASEREKVIADELDIVRTQLLQTRQENYRLNTLIEQFTRGAAIMPNLDVRQVHRPRSSNLIGDLLVIRTGKIQGLTQGTVVVVDAIQLLGKVTRVNDRVSMVRPITASSAQPILATILLDSSGENQLRCLLTPVGDGTLIGEVARPTTNETWQVRIDQEVRLLDDQWPQHAQMLMIGNIERIENNESQPLRQRIVVRPTVADLRRVSNVILRLPALDQTDGGDS